MGFFKRITPPAASPTPPGNQADGSELWPANIQAGLRADEFKWQNT